MNRLETIEECAVMVESSAGLWSNLRPAEARAFARFLARQVRQLKEDQIPIELLNSLARYHVDEEKDEGFWFVVYDSSQKCGDKFVAVAKAPTLDMAHSIAAALNARDREPRIVPSMVARIAAQAGMTQVSSCCAVADKFCATDVWQGNLWTALNTAADWVLAVERLKTSKVWNG
jgi:hypothetical protein